MICGLRARGVRLAARARLLREILARQSGKARKRRCQPRARTAAAQRLVGVIIGAQCIPMRQEHAFAVEFDDRRIGQELAAGARGRKPDPGENRGCHG